MDGDKGKVIIKKQICRNFLYILGVVEIFLTTQRCSPERDEYSFPPMLYDEQDYLREIESADNLITLNETRSKYAVALKKSESVTRALYEKWDLLSKEADKKGKKIGKLCDEAELIAFDFEKIGKNRFRLYFLFRDLQEFYSNYNIYLGGYLEESSLLPADCRKKGYMRWHLKPLPPTRFWKPGEYIVITSEITAPDLPFDLRINFDSSRGRHGIQLSLGTMRKIDQMDLNRESIFSEDDPFQLWQWLQISHARSAEIGDQVLNRFDEVTAALAPGTVAAENIEYYGARISRISSSRCNVRFLFRSLGPIESDYRILLYGSISPEDREYLSEARKKAGKKSEKWSFSIFPATSSWKPGKFIVISYSFEAKPISYDFFAMIYDREKKKAGPRFPVGFLDAPGSLSE